MLVGHGALLLFVKMLLYYCSVGVRGDAALLMLVGHGALLLFVKILLYCCSVAVRGDAAL